MEVNSDTTGWRENGKGRHKDGQRHEYTKTGENTVKMDRQRKTDRKKASTIFNESDNKTNVLIRLSDITSSYMSNMTFSYIQ